MNFDQTDLAQQLGALDSAGLDALPFGVIQVDGRMIVRRYNRYEALHTGLRAENVLGRHLFTEIAQCMNNYLVAQRIEDALSAGQALDATIDYVLTWRMRPTPVKLRMLVGAGAQDAYLLLLRTA
ncbi:MAG: PAS domain-containing protein [Rhodoferax sp.]